MSMIIGLIGVVVGLVGWFVYHSIIALIMGTVLYGVETAMEWKTLNANAKKLEVSIFVVGCIVSLFTAVPWYVGGMLAINIYSAIMTLPNIIVILMMIFRR